MLFISVIYLVLSENNAYNCWSKNNIRINVDELPALLKHFSFCVKKCQQLKNKECFNNVISQLKSSKLVLRELYYHGQIGFWVCVNN